MKMILNENLFDWDKEWVEDEEGNIIAVKSEGKELRLGQMVYDDKISGFDPETDTVFLTSDGIEERDYAVEDIIEILDQDIDEAIIDKKAMRKRKINEDTNSEMSIEEKLNYLKNYPTYSNAGYSQAQYTRPCKMWDLDLTERQKEEFGKFLEDGGLVTFWDANEYLSDNIYQEGRMGGHLVLDKEYLDPNNFIDVESYEELISEYLDDNFYPDLETEEGDYEYSKEQRNEAKEDVDRLINSSYTKLVDFDNRVNELIANLKATLDLRIENSIDDSGLDESVEGDQIAQDTIDSKNANFEKDKEAERQIKVELAKQGIVTESVQEVKSFLDTLVTNGRVRSLKDDEKAPRTFKFLSGTGNNGEVEFKGVKYAYAIVNGNLKVMKSTEAGDNWSETIFKENLDQEVVVNGYVIFYHKDWGTYFVYNNEGHFEDEEHKRYGYKTFEEAEARAKSLPKGIAIGNNLEEDLDNDILNLYLKETPLSVEGQLRLVRAAKENEAIKNSVLKEFKKLDYDTFDLQDVQRAIESGVISDYFDLDTIIRDKLIDFIKDALNVKKSFNEGFTPGAYDKEFNYQMLGRLQQDCEYYLGMGNRNPKHLWAHDEARQIEIMKDIYNWLVEHADKPEWISMEDIENYERQMLNKNESVNAKEYYLQKIQRPLTEDMSEEELDDLDKQAGFETVDYKGHKIIKMHFENATYGDKKLDPFDLYVIRKGLRVYDDSTIKRITDELNIKFNSFENGKKIVDYIVSNYEKNESLKEDLVFDSTLADKELAQKMFDEETDPERKKLLSQLLAKIEFELTGKGFKESFEDEHLGTVSEEIIPETPKDDKNGLASIIHNLIKDEFDAIQNYNDAVVNAEAEGFSDIAAIFTEIANDENKHVGSLEVALGLISNQAKMSTPLGEQEAKEIIVEDPEEGEHY